VNEKSGYKYDQNLDRSIIVMMGLLRRSIKTKTRDLTSKSLVTAGNSDEVNAIEYITLCLDIAESEFRQISMRQVDDNL
jgi:hypothetical protein